MCGQQHGEECQSAAAHQGVGLRWPRACGRAVMMMMVVTALSPGPVACAQA